MTPRQFDLLCKRWRADLAHREMVSAWTTAAVINGSMFRPTEPVNALQYMPNHAGFISQDVEPDLDDDALERLSDWNQAVMDRACALKEQAQRRGE